MNAAPDKAPTGLYVAALLALAVGLTALFWALGERSAGGIVHQSSDGGRAMVVIARDRSGHYLADGEINGQTVRFIVDTGATDVAIPLDLARRLGLEFGPRITLQTAAGPSQGWLTRLERVRLGALERRDVRATILSAPMDQVLLGMGFLQHYRLSQEDGELVIETGRSS